MGLYVRGSAGVTKQYRYPYAPERDLYDFDESTGTRTWGT